MGAHVYDDRVKAEAVRLIGQGVDVNEVRRLLFETFGCLPTADAIRQWWTRMGARS